ncbi:hypothetical protein SALBM217S_04566 [Streptomyces griseoloalbus]
MASVTSLTDLVSEQLTSALSATRPEASADPLLRRSDRADFQANGILALAKKAKANPRDLAAEVVSRITTGDVIKDVEVSGPGFLNITIADRAVVENLAARYADDTHVVVGAVPGRQVAAAEGGRRGGRGGRRGEPDPPAGPVGGGVGGLDGAAGGRGRRRHHPGRGDARTARPPSTARAGPGRRVVGDVRAGGRVGGGAGGAGRRG